MKNQSLRYHNCNLAVTFNSTRRIGVVVFMLLSGFFLQASAVFAQSAAVQNVQNVQLEQVRWKSEDQVRSMLGDPKSIRGPIGTHASYQLWNYEGFSVAFANNRAFHLFDEDSLKKFELEENR